MENKIEELESTGLFGDGKEKVSDDEKHREIVNLLTEIASISKDILIKLKPNDKTKSK